MPLRVALRDLLGVADNAREVRRMASEGRIKVDGVVRRDDLFPVGLFDVLTVGDTSYRMLLDEKDRFTLKEAPDADLKPVKAVDATTVKGGERQIHLSDGKNVTGDAPTDSTLLISLPDKEVEEVVEMESGNLAFITGGKHAGQVATIVEYEVVKSNNPNRVELERNGEEFSTVEGYVFVIGEEEPVVEI